MSILLAVTAWDIEPWRARIKALHPNDEIFSLHDSYDPATIHHALCWRHPHGLLASLPNLKSIHSLGAGVDHLLADPDLPKDVPVFRVIDRNLTAQMTEWVCLQVLAHHRKLPLYLEQQDAHTWKNNDVLPASRVRVGIMGFGEMGQSAGRALTALGYDVTGWRRTMAGAQSFAVFHGEDGLKEMLARTNILICLLPLTPDTTGILNTELFAKLEHGSSFGPPVIINAGRGKLQVEADIMTALDTNMLGGASLDVFEEEPLPVASELWDHPRVIITPHNAAVSNPDSVAAFVAQQIHDMRINLAPWGRVDLKRGY
jgi:glyoxylate/hydroxypyruvate reductase A